MASKRDVNHSLILYWYVSSCYVICDIMQANYNVQESQLGKVEKYCQLGYTFKPLCYVDLVTHLPNLG